MINRTHRRLAAVAGAALAIGFAAPASAIFVGSTSGTFAGINLDDLSVGTNIPANLPNDVDPVTNHLEGEVRTGLVDGILDRLLGSGDALSEVVGANDVLTELTGTAPLVQAPLVAPFPTSAVLLTGPLVGPTTLGGLLGAPTGILTGILAAPGSILSGISLF
jgi:hypothetical protein